ncbi:MAG: hypothetical protein AB8G99_18865, partial [Planctomycetaceae bacterium]
MSASNFRRLDVDQQISAMFAGANLFRPMRFEVSLGVIRAKSSLLKPTRIPHSESPSAMLDAINRLIEHKRQWCRPVETWRPPNGSRDVQFDSLVRHLFVQYELPAFMPRIWLRDCPVERRTFFHLAKGLSIRKCGYRCTKPMVPHFMCAPADVTVRQALRWAKARSLGAGKEFARAIAGTRLRQELPDEEFWNRVISFLVREEVGITEAGEIVEFLYRQKFMKGSEAYGLLGVNRPLQPKLDIAGRKLNWLRQRMANWRDEVPMPELQISNNAWAPTGISGFRKPNVDGLWTITEITSLTRLRAEGAIMRHCVFSSMSDCRKPHSSIWSL